MLNLLAGVGQLWWTKGVVIPCSTIIHSHSRAQICTPVRLAVLMTMSHTALRSSPGRRRRWHVPIASEAGDGSASTGGAALDGADSSVSAKLWNATT